MKVISLIAAHSDSGKTTTGVGIIKGLKARGFSVSAIKSIHIEGFSIDTKGKDTFRYAEAGASPIVALSHDETSIIFKRQLTFKEVLSFINTDWLIIEGRIKHAYNKNIPAIAVTDRVDDLDKLLAENVIAISGIVARDMRDYKGLPAWDALTDIDGLVDFLLDRVPDLVSID
jgi:molybdopterin-guanine dinucleotide biosynthesis adapter protein